MNRVTPEYVINEQGSKVKVILPVQDYQNMLQEILVLKAKQGDRRAFLSLNPTIRNQILNDQADKLLDHYQKDPEWREIETHDLYEYDDSSNS